MWTSEAIETLISKLNSNDPYMTLVCLNGSQDDEIPEINSSLIRLLSSSEENISYLAAQVIVYTQNQEIAVKTLQDALTSTTPHVRLNAIKGLTRMGNAASKAIESIVEILRNDSNDEVRFEAAAGLGWILESPEIAVPALIAALDDHAIEVVDASLVSLTKFGQMAADSLPRLIAMTHDRSTNRARAWMLKKVIHAIQQ